MLEGNDRILTAVIVSSVVF